MDGITDSRGQPTRGCLPVLELDWEQVLNPHSNKRCNFDILKDIAMKRALEEGRGNSEMGVKAVWSRC